MGIRPSVRSGTVRAMVGAATVAATVEVVVVTARCGLPASAGAAQMTAAAMAAMKVMGERMPLASANRPGPSILSSVNSGQRADPAVLGLAQQPAQPEEVVDAADDRDRDHRVGQQVQPQR